MLYFVFLLWNSWQGEGCNCVISKIICELDCCFLTDTVALNKFEGKVKKKLLIKLTWNSRTDNGSCCLHSFIISLAVAKSSVVSSYSDSYLIFNVTRWKKIIDLGWYKGEWPLLKYWLHHKNRVSGMEFLTIFFLWMENCFSGKV